MRYIRNDARAGCAACRREPQPRQAACPATECAHLPVMAFVPVQTWDCTYTCGQALVRGTLFPTLDKPFMGKGGCCNG